MVGNLERGEKIILFSPFLNRRLSRCYTFALLRKNNAYSITQEYCLVLIIQPSLVVVLRTELLLLLTVFGCPVTGGCSGRKLFPQPSSALPVSCCSIHAFGIPIPLYLQSQVNQTATSSLVCTDHEPTDTDQYLTYNTTDHAEDRNDQSQRTIA